MRTKTIEIFNFEELTKEIQDKVLDDNRTINVDTDYWYEYFLEDFVIETNKLGFEINQEDITFDIQSRASKFGVKANDLSVTINDRIYTLQEGLTHFGYCYSDFPNRCWMKSEIRIECDSEPEKDDSDTIEQQAIGEFQKLLDLCEEYYKKLSKAYDYEMTDEAVKETIVCNEYEFLANGDRN